MAKRIYGPGPGAYRLPPTVGYDGHDPSRFRNPMFSFGGIYIARLKGALGPGPVYKIDRVTRDGVQYAPAWTFGGKFDKKDMMRNPGPGAHAPERCPVLTTRAPVYSFGQRLTRDARLRGPAPNAYMVRGGRWDRGPAWTMAARLGGKGGALVSPGPAAYYQRNQDVYRPKLPTYSLAARLAARGENQARSPGPACYGNLYNTKKAPFAFSFGTKHAEWAPPLIVADDDMPCLDH